MPTDALYVLIVKIAFAGPPDADPDKEFKVLLEAQWRNPHGYLSAIDYPLLHFYGFMCAVYIILSLVWLIICFKHWKDLLRIQFWIGNYWNKLRYYEWFIGAVIIVGMIEKAVFYAEYANMNDAGESVEGLIEVIIIWL